jgi:hypothetical protein
MNPIGQIMTFTNSLKIVMATWNSQNSILTITTKTNPHGLAPGDVIAQMVIRPIICDPQQQQQQPPQPFVLRNYQIQKGDSCNMDSNVLSITIDSSLWAAFAQAGITSLPNSSFGIADSSSFTTYAMEKNIGKTIGFTKSVKQTVLSIIGVAFDVASGNVTFTTNVPHALTVGSYVTINMQQQTITSALVTVTPHACAFAIHNSTFTSSFSPAGDLTNAFAFPTDGANHLSSVLAISPQKVDLTLQNRIVLIHCKINGAQEIGNVFVPGVNNRFFARVQLAGDNGAIQFYRNPEHVIGVFQLELPILKVNSVRISLYNETGLVLYDTHGVEWSAVLEFMCDNGGNM